MGGEVGGHLGSLVLGTAPEGVGAAVVRDKDAHLRAVAAAAAAAEGTGEAGAEARGEGGPVDLCMAPPGRAMHHAHEHE